MTTARKDETMTSEPTTCAEYRKLANECEKRRDYYGAAAAWQSAIDFYPESLRKGDLYREDVRRMRENIQVCLSMARDNN